MQQALVSSDDPLTRDEKEVHFAYTRAARQTFGKASIRTVVERCDSYRNNLAFTRK